MDGRRTRIAAPRFVRVAERIRQLGDTDAEIADALGVSERTVTDLKKGILPYWFTRLAVVGLHEDYVEDARAIYAAAAHPQPVTPSALD